MIFDVVIIVACTLAFVFSDSVAAQWGKYANNYWLIPLFIMAPVGYVFFGIINKKNTLAQSSIIVNMGLLIGTFIIGYFVFKEPVSWKTGIAFICALVAIFFANS